MNPLLKAWLVDVLKKAGQSGGATVLEEVLAAIPQEQVVTLRDICERVLKRGKVDVRARVVGTP
jgi:hypothetical protein